jgi:signal transduction histidine kinase
VRGDPRLLRRLVRNLLENAKRHGAPPIEVTVRRVHRNGSAAVELSVRDHGVGVPDSEQEKIFDPFYRMAGATSTGTGLGLSLVRQIARKHSGEAHCDRAAGGGTRITVTLASAEHVP